MRLLTLRTVVVATDLDPSSHPAIAAANGLASAAGAALHVVHAVPPGSRDGRAMSMEDAAGSLRDAARHAGADVVDSRLHVIPGEPAETIGAFGDRMSADVIVVGPHRSGPRAGAGQPLGGTARAIAERATAPCLIVAGTLRLPLERVLVPTDFSDTARGALLVAISWASALRAGAAARGATSLTALHIEPEGEGVAAAAADEALARELELLQDETGRWAGVDLATCVVRARDAASAIRRHAADSGADLVVIGTRGSGADEVSRLGSVSAEVTRHVRVPTLLVPPAVWRAHAERRAR